MNSYFNLLPLEINIIILSDLSSLEISSVLKIICNITLLNNLTTNDICNKIIFYRYRDIYNLFTNESERNKWIYDEIYNAKEIINNNKIIQKLVNVSIVDKYKIAKGFLYPNLSKCKYIYTRGRQFNQKCERPSYFYDHCEACHTKTNAIINLEKERDINKDILLMMKDIKFRDIKMKFNL